MKKIKIAVIGLGLMGGSLVKALKGNNYEIWGLDINESVVKEALQDEYIAHGDYNLEEAFKWAQVIMPCILPSLAVSIIEKYKKYMTDGKILSDFCGIKRVILECSKDFAYVGLHTMAGKEKGGYENSSEALFKNSNAIITPNSIAKESDISVIENIAKSIGCKNIIIADPSTHDKMIAFTSELMHIIACSIVNHDDFLPSFGFEGNSLGDHTRVGTIDANMWSELFFLNSDYLKETLSKYIETLEKFKTSLDNKEDLKKLLELSNYKKNIWLSKKI